MRFCSLGSGSSGNATLIEAHDGIRTTRLLVDCGFTLRELGLRLVSRGVELGAIDAVFVTHEHGDHVGCALALARRHRVPLWMSAGTWAAIGSRRPPPSTLHWARAGVAIEVGALQIMPFAVPHDAAEPLQLRCSDGNAHLGLLTDLGEGTDAVAAQLTGCDALLLECNHDHGLLADGPYPAFLKRRIGGPLGHLANHQAASLLQACKHAALRHVVAAHLSLHNNRPEMAASALAAALQTDANEIVIANPRSGCGWLDVG